MKKSIIILAISILYSLSISAQISVESLKLQENGHRSLRQGDYDNAIILFSQAVRLDPSEVSLRRDLAYAYYLSGELKKANEIISPVLNSDFADEQTFQIAAVIENTSGKKNKAKRILRQGIAKFPYSGLLFHNQGNLLFRDKNEKGALESWQTGINVDPLFAMNYYNAAKAYSENDNHVWAILYGEIYLNLDQDVTRGLEIKKLIIDSYKGIFSPESNESLPEFKKSARTQSNQNDFTEIFKNIVLQNGAILRRGLDTEGLIMLRTRILLEWKTNYSINHPFTLFSYHEKLLHSGNFDAYNQWLFGAYNNSQEFSIWIKTNSNVYTQFENWRKLNPLQPAIYDPKP